MRILGVRLEVAANVFLIGGAALFAVLPDLALKWWLFIFFLAGHVIWLWHGYLTKDAPLMQLNLGMIALDCYAIVVRLID